MKNNLNTSIYKYIFDMAYSNIIVLVHDVFSKKYHFSVFNYLYKNILIKSNFNCLGVISDYIRQKNEK